MPEATKLDRQRGHDLAILLAAHRWFQQWTCRPVIGAEGPTLVEDALLWDALDSARGGE